jgi:RES domain-containing protein
VNLQAPPEDPAQLAEFPSHYTDEKALFARIHHAQREAAWFCPAADDRFCPPSSASGFGTCYLSTTHLGAFMEKFGQRGSFLPVVAQERLDECAIANVVLPITRLADIASTHAARWGITLEHTASTDYQRTRLWAERFYQAGFGGIRYLARHDPSGNLESIALFGKPGVQEGAFVVTRTEPITWRLTDEVRDRFGISVASGPLI